VFKGLEGLEGFKRFKELGVSDECAALVGEVRAKISEVINKKPRIRTCPLNFTRLLNQLWSGQVRCHSEQRFQRARTSSTGCRR